MDVSENSDTPKSSILIGFSIINRPFWGTPIFGNLHIVFQGVFPLCFPLVPLEPPNEAALRARVSSRFDLMAREGVGFSGAGVECKLVYLSGQIIATSHDLTPNGGLVREIPLFQGSPCW